MDWERRRGGLWRGMFDQKKYLDQIDEKNK
jgi:hypothetical protein